MKKQYSPLYFFISLARIIKFAFKNFLRNKGIAMGAIFILTITLFLLTALVFFYGITNHLISQIRERIDITAYFKEDTPLEDIMAVRDELLKMFPEIKSVNYLSKEEALILFQQRYKENVIFQKALEEVGENPFLPSLNITIGGDPSYYQEISEMLEQSAFAKQIERVDYTEKKDIINKIYSFTSNVKKVGISISLILLIISLLVILNTIKLAIENSKEEINTMKVVGASDWFLRGPFIVEGVIYGFLSFLICFSVTSVLVYLLSSETKNLLGGFDIFDYFLTNWKFFILIQLGFGMGVGIMSSLISINKYLEK